MTREPGAARRTVARPDVHASVAIPLAIAAFLLGYALKRNDGLYEHTARNALVVSMAAALSAVVGPRLLALLRRGREVASARRERSLHLLKIVAAVVLAYDVYAILASGPFWPGTPAMSVTVFRAGIWAAALLAATALLEPPPLGRWHMPLLFVVHALIGIWAVRAVPAPPIDVYYFHTEAFRALAAGHSPYSITIPLLYGAKAPFYYGEGLVAGDHVQVGHPYPPLSLLLALVGHACGDYRYALVAAVVAAAALLAYAHRGGSGRVAAILLLFTPRIFLVYAWAWTDPFVVTAAAAIAFCAARKPRWLPVALGGLIAVKQYGVLALPLLPLLLPWRSNGRQPTLVRTACLAIGLAAAVTLPFVLWDPTGFVNSVILFQLRQPFRPDSLSLLHGVADHSIVPLTSAFSAVATLAAIGLSLWLAPRTVAGFLASLAFTLIVFFGFAKQAFANYYFAVIGVMLSGVAMSVRLANWPPLPSPWPFRRLDTLAHDSEQREPPISC